METCNRFGRYSSIGIETRRLDVLYSVKFYKRYTEEGTVVKVDEQNLVKKVEFQKASNGLVFVKEIQYSDRIFPRVGYRRERTPSHTPSPSPSLDEEPPVMVPIVQTESKEQIPYTDEEVQSPEQPIPEFSYKPQEYVFGSEEFLQGKTSILENSAGICLTALTGNVDLDHEQQNDSMGSHDNEAVKDYDFSIPDIKILPETLSEYSMKCKRFLSEASNFDRYDSKYDHLSELFTIIHRTLLGIQFDTRESLEEAYAELKQVFTYVRNSADLEALCHMLGYSLAPLAVTRVEPRVGSKKDIVIFFYGRIVSLLVKEYPGLEWVIFGHFFRKFSFLMISEETNFYSLNTDYGYKRADMSGYTSFFCGLLALLLDYQYATYWINSILESKRVHEFTLMIIEYFGHFICPGLYGEPIYHHLEVLLSRMCIFCSKKPTNPSSRAFANAIKRKHPECKECDF